MFKTSLPRNGNSNEYIFLNLESSTTLEIIQDAAQNLKKSFMICNSDTTICKRITLKYNRR
jgi:hypothetical protein